MLKLINVLKNGDLNIGIHVKGKTLYQKATLLLNITLSEILGEMPNLIPTSVS